MSSVESPEKSLKKKKGLLGDMNERLGLSEGTELVAPSLRNRVQQMGPIGMPFAADIALEQRRTQGMTGNLSNNPSVTATAKMTRRTKEQVISNLGR